MSHNRSTTFPVLARALFLGWGLVGVQPAWATFTEADFFDDQPIVLSASRLLQSLKDAPAAVTVIDQDMIRASGFRDIPDLLRLVPGFSVAYTRDNTWALGYHGLADAHSRRYQVLVDGRSIYSPHFGAVYWADLPLAIDDIERIEVVRGPNAATYGANAFLAVINIITKTAAQVPGEFVSVQAGNKDMRGLTVRHGGGDEALRYRLTASAQQRDRFDRYVTFKTDRDNGEYFEATKTYFVNGRMDWQLSPSSDVMAQFGLSQGDWEAGRRVDDLARRWPEPVEQDSRAQYLQLAYHKVESASREWRVQAYYSRNRFDADKLTYEAPLILFEDQYMMQTRSNIDLQVNEQWRPGLRGVWGGEVRHETVNSPYQYDTSATLSGALWRVFGNLEWQATDQLLVQGGAMLEHHYYTGADISPRVALNYTLHPEHVLRFSVSQAYRSPTFYEQDGNLLQRDIDGTPVDRTKIPSSTALEPERLFSREIGYVGQFKPLALNLNARLFYDTLSDYIGSQRIVTEACNEPESEPENRCRERINASGLLDQRGWEAELNWRPLPGLDLTAHYTRTKISTRGDVIDKDLPLSAPRNIFGMLARYGWGDGWQASVGLYQTDQLMWLSDGDVTEGFTRVDARLARRWNWQGHEVEAAVVGQNLGDDYTEFRDTNVFSRRVYGSLSLAW
jgi:iron complex outermembrane recepter protein